MDFRTCQCVEGLVPDEENPVTRLIPRCVDRRAGNDDDDEDSNNSNEYEYYEDDAEDLPEYPSDPDDFEYPDLVEGETEQLQQPEEEQEVEETEEQEEVEEEEQQEEEETQEEQPVEEGISAIMDPQFIDADSVEELANNFCRPSGTRKTAHLFSIASQMKMIDTANYAQHCIVMGGEVLPNHCHCIMMQHFVCQWKALEKQRDGDQPMPPEVGKDLNVLQWSKAFREFLMQKIGMHGAPL